MLPIYFAICTSPAGKVNLGRIVAVLDSSTMVDLKLRLTALFMLKILQAK